mgnify:CR=1 FL=1
MDLTGLIGDCVQVIDDLDPAVPFSSITEMLFVRGGPAVAWQVARDHIDALARQMADAGKLVAGRLEAWRQAWEAKDSARYLAFYGSTFVPAGNKPRAAWETDRRAKLDKKGEIKVVLGAPSFKLEGEVVRLLCARATPADFDRLVRRLQATLGHTVVIITHDREIAAMMPRTVAIRDGKIEQPVVAA